MDGIRKYSKEWFTLKGADEQSKYISELKNGSESKLATTGKSISSSLFLGTAEDVQKKYDSLVESEKGKRPSDTQMNIKKYGLDNIFSVLDSNGDGTVSQNEIDDIAALSTKELAEKNDTSFTTDDLDILYNNALSAVNSSFEQNGKVTDFKYENGDSTQVTLNNYGKIEKKVQTSVNNDGSKSSVSYNYADKSKTETNYDSLGRITRFDYDSQDNKKDYTTTNTYADDGSKTVNTKKYVTNTTQIYDKNGKLVSEDLKYNYESDGKIDATKQQTIGDCWVLAGVNALNQSAEGKKMLSDSIQHNDDGSITVKLKGVNKEYTYSAEEIIDNKYYTPNKSFSKGDTDMNLFEKAIGQYRKELIESGDYKKNGRDLEKTAGKNATPEDPLKGGQIDEAIYYITGIKSEYSSASTGDIKEDALAYFDKLNSNGDKYIMNAAFKENDSSTIGIITDHAYSINRVDDDYVYVVNPHDSSREIAYEKEKFLDNVRQITVTDLSSTPSPKKDSTLESSNTNQQENINQNMNNGKSSKIKNFLKKLFS